MATKFLSLVIFICMCYMFFKIFEYIVSYVKKIIKEIKEEKKQ